MGWVQGNSRDTFYRYRDAVKEGGVEALFERTRRKPNIVTPENNGQEAPYLKRYRTKALEQNYLPILALNIHQLAHSLALISSSAGEAPDVSQLRQEVEEESGQTKIMEAGDAAGLARKKWHNLRSALSLMHARFRFRQISPISMQNSFNQALRDCFGLNSLELQLEGDLERMEGHVQTELSFQEEARKKRNEKRFGWFSQVAAALATGILGIEYASLLHEFSKDTLTNWEKVGLCSIGGLVLLGFGFAFAGRK